MRNLRLGGFHILMAFLGTIGKRMESSGLEDILIESGTFASGSIPTIMSGKAYNRAVRAHKLMAEALPRILNDCIELCDGDVAKAIRSQIMKVREHFANSKADNIPSAVDNLSVEVNPFIQKKTTLCTEGKKTSTMFSFWHEYLQMVDILLHFIRAERTGHWELHLSSLAAMIPYFFAYDRMNYARYATVYLAQM